MIPNALLEDWFTYHDASPEQLAKYAAIREAETQCHLALGYIFSGQPTGFTQLQAHDHIRHACLQLARVINQACPIRSETVLAIQECRKAGMLANELCAQMYRQAPLNLELAGAAKTAVITARLWAVQSIALVVADLALLPVGQDRV